MSMKLAASVEPFIREKPAHTEAHQLSLSAPAPAASGTPEPQVASHMLTECMTTKGGDLLHSPLPSRKAVWLEVILKAHPKGYIYSNAMQASCCNAVDFKKKRKH